jgi:hypothetical protein
VTPLEAYRQYSDLGFNPHTRTGCDLRAKLLSHMLQSFNPHTRTGCDLHHFIYLPYNELHLQICEPNNKRCINNIILLPYFVKYRFCNELAIMRTSHVFLCLGGSQKEDFSVKSDYFGLF